MGFLFHFFIHVVDFVGRKWANEALLVYDTDECVREKNSQASKFVAMKIDKNMVYLDIISMQLT